MVQICVVCTSITIVDVGAAVTTVNKNEHAIRNVTNVVGTVAVADGIAKVGVTAVIAKVCPAKDRKLEVGLSFVATRHIRNRCNDDLAPTVGAGKVNNICTEETCDIR